MIGNISAASDIQNLIIFRHLEVIFTLAWMSLEDGGRGGGRADKEIWISIYFSNPCLLLCMSDNNS